MKALFKNVPVLDSGEYDGRPFCVLPYMDGGTLRHRLDREKQLPLADVIAIMVPRTHCTANAVDIRANSRSRVSGLSGRRTMSGRIPDYTISMNIVVGSSRSVFTSWRNIAPSQPSARR